MKKGLGRGIDSMIPVKENGSRSTSKKNETVKEVIKEVVKEVPVEKKLKVSDIEPNREQPRKVFDKEALQELAESIKKYGVVQPIVVQQKEGYYEIIAGERRWRAAKLAKVKEVPVVIKDYTTREAMEIALIENIQRQDLNPIEEAMAYKRLIDEYSLSQEELAKEVSKSRSAITNSLRLLNLTKKVREMVINDELTMGHARALLAIQDEEKQLEAAKKIVENKINVRDTEKLVKSIIKPKKEETGNSNPEEEIRFNTIQKKLESITGSKVSINRKKGNKGKIEIDYYSYDDLERLLELFDSIQG